MKAVVGACLVSILGVVQIGLACAVSAVLGHYLHGSFPIADSDYTATCGLSMTANSYCIAGYVSTAMTIGLCLVLISMQCMTLDAHKHGFWGPILSVLGFIWWAAYAGAATSAAHTGNHWDSTLTTYRTVVVALSWCICGLFIPSLVVSAASVSAAARAGMKLAGPRASSAVVRFSQPPSPPVSPCKSNKSFGSAYEPFKETESPKKWVQPHNPSTRFAVTSDGLRTLLVVGGQPVPLSPGHSACVSPARSPMARSPLAGSPTARSPVHRSLTLGGAGAFTNVLLPQGSQDLSGHPGHV